MEEKFFLISLGIPLLTALCLPWLGKRPNLREGLTLCASLLLLFVVGSFALYYLDEHPSLHYTLIELVPGITLSFNLEPLGMIFASVAAILWPINSLYSIGYMRGNKEKHQSRFYTCFALAIACALGIAFSGNLVTLFVFYEAMTLCTYPLVTHKGTREAQKGGRTYLGTLLGTSIALFLPAIIMVWHVSGTTDFTPGGVLNGSLSGPAVGILLALFAFGIGKAALMPFHKWLPGAMVAPTPVSALLHAVAVVKAGVFCIVKVVVYVFGLDLLRAEASTQWLIYAAGFTIISASLIALRQDNLKRRLAYSTVSQLSYVILAAALFTPTAIMGAALHIMAHAFGKITLFFAAGAIYTAAHKTNVSQLDGIGRRMPWTMGAFTVGALSMIGVPPAAGFISKWYILTGAMEREHLFAIGIVIASTLLNAAYFIPIVYRAFFKASPQGEHDEHPVHGEAPLPMVIALCATAGLTLWTFFFPGFAHGLARLLMELGT